MGGGGVGWGWLTGEIPASDVELYLVSRPHAEN